MIAGPLGGRLTQQELAGELRQAAAVAVVVGLAAGPADDARLARVDGLPAFETIGDNLTRAGRRRRAWRLLLLLLLGWRRRSRRLALVGLLRWRVELVVRVVLRLVEVVLVGRLGRRRGPCLLLGRSAWVMVGRRRARRHQLLLLRRRLVHPLHLLMRRWRR